MNVIAQSEAKAQGLRRYFTGEPCYRGHISERYIEGTCVQCTQERNASEDQKKNRRDYLNSRYANDPDFRRKVRLAVRLRKSGWTEGQFQKAWEDQQGKCECCRKPLKYPDGTAPPGNRDVACADHDHQTKKPRGILCQACNNALGFAQDDPEILRQLAWYLERHQ